MYLAQEELRGVRRYENGGFVRSAERSPLGCTTIREQVWSAAKLTSHPLTASPLVVHPDRIHIPTAVDGLALSEFHDILIAEGGE